MVYQCEPTNELVLQNYVALGPSGISYRYNFFFFFFLCFRVTENTEFRVTHMFRSGNDPNVCEKFASHRQTRQEEEKEEEIKDWRTACTGVRA